MEHIATIISLVGTALGLLTTAITFFVRFLRSARGRKVAENVLEINDVLLSFIKQAEMLVGQTGPDKKEFVMNKALQFAIERNITFNPSAVNEKIEELVQLTNEVNIRKQSETKEKPQTFIFPARR